MMRMMIVTKVISLSSLSPEEESALKTILDLILPFSAPDLNTLASHYLRHGYDRDFLIKFFLEEVKKDPLSSIRLRLIYAELDRVYREGLQNVRSVSTGHIEF